MPNFKYLNQPQIGHLASDPLLQSCGCWILRGIITRKSLTCDCDTAVHWAGGWHGTPVTRPVRGRRKWKLRAEQWRADQWVRGQLGLRDPLSRLCSDNATLRLRVSPQSGHNVTAGLRCSQTFTFVTLSQTIHFPEFLWINAESWWLCIESFRDRIT